MYDWNDGWGAGMWVAMGLMMLAFWVLLVVLVVHLVRNVRQEADGNHAMQILDERFARGDIDIDDFNQRRGLLGREPRT